MRLSFMTTPTTFLRQLADTGITGLLKLLLPPTLQVYRTRMRTAKKVLESTPKLLVLSDQDGFRLLSVSFQKFREIKGEGFATSRSMI